MRDEIKSFVLILRLLYEILYFSNGRNLKSLLDLLISSSFLSSSIFLVFLKRLKDMRDEIKSFVLILRLLYEILYFSNGRNLKSSIF